jgi:DNA adenine methylase
MTTTTAFTAVPPAKPLAPYVGGKRLLAKHIIPIINSIPHDVFIDAFFGMGGIFLRRDRKSRTEVINDINGEICNLMRVVQHHHEELKRSFKYLPISRKIFKDLLVASTHNMTDIQRAARWLYLQKCGYGGCGKHFSVGNDRRCRADRFVALLDAVHEKLMGVHIEQLHFAELIKRWDRPTTLFYWDPPYHGNEDDYGKANFEQRDFERLAEMGAEMKGVFILSINDTPFIREAFRAFEIRTIDTLYSVGRTNRDKPVTELLITNYREGF